MGSFLLLSMEVCSKGKEKKTAKLRVNIFPNSARTAKHYILLNLQTLQVTNLLGVDTGKTRDGESRLLT